MSPILVLAPTEYVYHQGANPILPRIIGGALMSFLPTSNESGILAGIYLVNAVVAPLAIFYQVRLTHMTKICKPCAPRDP